MDTKNLSKIKYVYQIYSAKRIVHCERFPVIYINSKYLWHKQPMSSELYKLRLSSVEDEFESSEQLILTSRNEVNCFFFKVKDFNSSAVTSEVFAKVNGNVLEEAKMKMINARKNYTKLLENYEKLKRSISE